MYWYVLIVEHNRISSRYSQYLVIIGGKAYLLFFKLFCGNYGTNYSTNSYVFPLTKYQFYCACGYISRTEQAWLKNGVMDGTR